MVAEHRHCGSGALGRAALLALLMWGCGEAVPAPAVEAWALGLDDVCRSAEAARAAGRLDEARETLSLALAQPSPETPLSPAARTVVASATFDLGRVELEAGEPERALALADRALDQLAGGEPGSRAPAPTVLVASLHALRALALEARARHDEAIAAWEAAQRVHMLLFERALAAPEVTTP